MTTSNGSLLPSDGGIPLRVAVVGAGPAGFYAALDLFDRDDIDVRVDMFDRLPTPYGLVRYGVAPDHQKIKSVTAVYERGVERRRRPIPLLRQRGAGQGRDASTTCWSRYHAIVFTYGAQTDRHARHSGRGPARRLRRAVSSSRGTTATPIRAAPSFDLDAERRGGRRHRQRGHRRGADPGASTDDASSRHRHQP